MPLTFRAITVWYGELINNSIHLRDVIDLEATYARIEGNKTQENKFGNEAGGISDGKNVAEEEDFRPNLSIVAMEEQIKPQMIEKLKGIVSLHKQLLQSQNKRMGKAVGRLRRFTKPQEDKYQRLRNELVGEISSLEFHNNRIETLLDQLRVVGKSIVGVDTKLIRLADKQRINRREFRKELEGCELEPGWIDRMKKESRLRLARVMQ